jgi:hypothetical protein
MAVSLGNIDFGIAEITVLGGFGTRGGSEQPGPNGAQFLIRFRAFLNTTASQALPAI